MMRPPMPAEPDRALVEGRGADAWRRRGWAPHPGRGSRTSRARLSDLPAVLATGAVAVVAATAVDGTLRDLLLGLGAGLAYIALFLLFGEVMWGRRPRGRRPAPVGEADSEVLRVMRAVMHVRPEPFSGRASSAPDVMTRARASRP